MKTLERLLGHSNAERWDDENFTWILIMKKFIWVVTICLLNFVPIQVFADSLAIPLKQGMKYDKARKALINAGWQAESKSYRIPEGVSSAEATSCGNSSDFGVGMQKKTLQRLHNPNKTLWAEVVTPLPKQISRIS
ncbi:MAG: hypothetical protein Q8N30_15290 [Methylococcales bacterium]|nr:hypothetical protein [Methylococcales bacterium]